MIDAWDYYQIYYPEDDDDDYYFTTENDQNKKYKYTNMAARGDGFDLHMDKVNPDDTKIDIHDQDEEEEEEEVKTTRPFQPQGTSTPAQP